MYPKVIQDLIDDFAKLPSIGAKSAERLVLSLLSKSEEYVSEFANHLSILKQQIKTCQKCGFITTDEFCELCLNPLRDQSVLMVLADVKDIFAVEKIGSYHGLYHNLGGLIDYTKGIDVTDLDTDKLINRINPSLKEIIIATNGTVEGELTANYLKELLKEYPIAVSRLGYGIPVGIDLKYSDAQTLMKAVENRRKY